MTIRKNKCVPLNKSTENITIIIILNNHIVIFIKCDCPHSFHILLNAQFLQVFSIDEIFSIVEYVSMDCKDTITLCIRYLDKFNSIWPFNFRLKLIFATLTAASKNATSFKSDQNKLKNSNHAYFTKVPFKSMIHSLEISQLVYNWIFNESIMIWSIGNYFKAGK